jgi:hypothetical protein
VDCRPLRGVLALVIQDHPNRAGTDLRGIWGNSLRHGSILSGVGASGTPGRFSTRQALVNAFGSVAGRLREGGEEVNALAKDLRSQLARPDLDAFTRRDFWDALALSGGKVVGKPLQSAPAIYGARFNDQLRGHGEQRQSEEQAIIEPWVRYCIDMQKLL